MRSLIIYHQRCIAHFFALSFYFDFFRFICKMRKPLGGAASVQKTHKSSLYEIILYVFSLSLSSFHWYSSFLSSYLFDVSSENDLFSMLIAQH